MTFAPLGTSAEAKDDETVLDVARRAGAPLANSCGAVGVCARCKVSVVYGQLSDPTARELKFGNLGERERLACQAVVTGDCVVSTTYW